MPKTLFREIRRSPLPRARAKSAPSGGFGDLLSRLSFASAKLSQTRSRKRR
jgi:hypothetical protein